MIDQIGLNKIIINAVDQNKNCDCSKDTPFTWIKAWKLKVRQKNNLELLL